MVEPKPPNHIIFSLIVFLLFCWVFGLIALIMGMQVSLSSLSQIAGSSSHLQVDSAWAAGDRNRARRLSASARGWNLAGMIVGTVVYVLAVVSAVASSAA